MAQAVTKSPQSLRSAKQALDFLDRLDATAGRFRGSFEELESAIGMMVLGRLVGWKVLILIHNKRTIRKYEKILGISIREVFDAEGPLTGKSVAYELATKADQFWKAVSGEFKVARRRELTE